MTHALPVGHQVNLSVVGLRCHGEQYIKVTIGNKTLQDGDDVRPKLTQDMTAR